MQENKTLKVITIDGPLASGKTSVSKKAAKALSWSWVSTGAFYRAVAFIVQKKGIDLTEEMKIVNLIDSVPWQVIMESDRTAIYIEGKNVNDETMYSESFSDIASQISSLPKVREALLQPQRDCLKQAQGGLIAEGRDCGSVVFPNADLKIYLTASSLLRSQRRSLEFNLTNQQALDYQKKRDVRDSQRKTAPLKIAEGAQVIDTSQKDLETISQMIIKKALHLL